MGVLMYSVDYSDYLLYAPSAHVLLDRTVTSLMPFIPINTVLLTTYGCTGIRSVP